MQQSLNLRNHVGDSITLILGFTAFLFGNTAGYYPGLAALIRYQVALYAYLVYNHDYGLLATILCGCLSPAETAICRIIPEYYAN